MYHISYLSLQYSGSLIGMSSSFVSDNVTSPTANTSMSIDSNDSVPVQKYKEILEQLKASNVARIRLEHQCRKADERSELLSNIQKNTQQVLLHRLKGQISSMQFQIDELKGELDLAENENKKIVDSVNNGQYTPDLEAIQQLKEENRQLRVENAEKQQIIDNLRVETMEHQRIADDAHARLLRSDNSQEVEQLVQLQVQIDRIILEKRVKPDQTDDNAPEPMAISLMNEVEMLRRQKVNSDAMIEKLRHQLTTGTHSDFMDNNQSDGLIEAENKIKVLTEELMLLSQSMATLSSGDSSVSAAELTKLKSEIQQLQYEVKAKDEINRKSDTLLRKREEQLKLLKDNAQAKLIQASEELKKIKSECTELRNERQASQIEQERTITQMHNQLINARTASVAERRIILNAMNQEIVLLKADNEAIREEIQQAASSGLEGIGKTIVQHVGKQISQQNIYIDTLRSNYEREVKLRKKIFNQLQELKGNIRVYARLRPMSDKERSDKTNTGVVFSPRDGELRVNNVEKKAMHNFEFEKVFTPTSTQQEVFEEVQDLVVSVLDGYNVCIFAYGQTGSGKTYTMEGYGNQPGVNTRALDKIFADAKAKSGEWDYKLRVTLLEIYNEKVQDLLQDSENSLKVVQGKDGMEVLGLTHVTVDTAEDVQKWLAKGKNNRHVTKTDMNEQSSRSHLILSIYASGRNIHTGAVANGKLHLIDLAGSERISRSGVTGEALKEAQKINYSLSALGNVISARANKNNHVPYRDSMLTYLLQDSLEKNSKTLMFVQLSPTNESVTETLCSLRFAERVRKVELGKAGKNVKETPAVYEDDE